jgi:hypothetical protein
MVDKTSALSLSAGQVTEWCVDAHCMNIMCGCPSNRPMYLTDLYMPGSIHSQGTVWNMIGKHLNQYVLQFGGYSRSHGGRKKKKK